MGTLLLSERTRRSQRPPHERRFPTDATRPVRLMRALKGARQRLGRLFRELRQVRRGARREAHETCIMAERGSLSLDGAAALICKAEFPWQIRGSLKWYGQCRYSPRLPRSKLRLPRGARAQLPSS